MHLACRFGSQHAVLALLEAGAAPDTRDAEGNTPLHWLFKNPLSTSKHSSDPSVVPGMPLMRHSISGKSTGAVSNLFDCRTRWSQYAEGKFGKAGRSPSSPEILRRRIGSNHLSADIDSKNSRRSRNLRTRFSASSGPTCTTRAVHLTSSSGLPELDKRDRETLPEFKERFDFALVALETTGEGIPSQEAQAGC